MDDYTVELFLKKTVNFKRIEKNRTRYVSLGQSETMEVKFSGYPPSFFSTPLFYASLLPIFLLILIFALAVFLYFKKPWESIGAASEEENIQNDKRPRAGSEEPKKQSRSSKIDKEDLDEPPPDDGVVPTVDDLLSDSGKKKSPDLKMK
jgi:hypothetical protein